MRKRVTKRNEGQFINLYKKGLGTVRIANITGFSKATVYRHASKFMKLRSNKKVNKKTIECIIQLYRKGLTTRKIEKRLNLGHETARTYLHLMNVEILPGTLKRIKKQSKKLTLKKTYMLGVLGPGDGYAYVDKLNSYRIGLKATNKQFVEFFNKCLEDTYGLKTYRHMHKYGNPNHKPQFTSQILSKLALEDLKIYNVSFNEKDWRVPEIIKSSSNIIKATYLRGIADSQGNVHVNGRKLHLASKNTEGMQEVKELLVQLGIKDISLDKTGITITARRSIIQFAKKINFVIKYKHENLSQLINSYKIWTTPCKDVDKLMPEISRLRESGCTHQIIADNLNISRVCVTQRLNKNNSASVLLKVNK